MTCVNAAYRTDFAGSWSTSSSIENGEVSKRAFQRQTANLARVVDEPKLILSET